MVIWVKMMLLTWERCQVWLRERPITLRKSWSNLLNVTWNLKSLHSQFLQAAACCSIGDLLTGRPTFAPLRFLPGRNALAQGKSRNRNQEIWISPSSCSGGGGGSGRVGGEGGGAAALLGAAVYSASFNLPSGCNLLWFTQGEQRLL